MFDPKRQRRRTTTTVLLILASGLLVWGSLVFHVHPGSAAGHSYWGFCAAAALTSVAGALWEIGATLLWIRSHRAATRVRLGISRIAEPPAGVPHRV